MKTLFLILFMIISCSNDNNHFPVTDEGIYIYEYSIKKPGEAYVGFITINDSLIVHDVCFTINFSNGRIKNVTKEERIKTKGHDYYIKEDGNIFIEGFGLLSYSSENFNTRNKLIPDNIYKMISPDFFNMTNKERLNLLCNLASAAN